MKLLAGIALLVVSLAVEAMGQSDAPLPTTMTTSESDTGWAFSLSASTYFVPDEQDYVQPTFTADREWLHLEARYNYEELHTGSAWAGYNLAGGTDDEWFAWEFTPMLGGVFGDVTGVAPGYRASLTFGKLDFYTEGEYFVDTGDDSASFFYAWSELTFAPVDWFHFGIAAQRTQADDAETHVQPGVVVGFSYKQLEFSAYVFDPTESRPTVVLTVGFNF